VPLSVLLAAPWSLIYNDGIFVQIIATNFYGNSTNSLTGGGATMVLVPQAPVGLTQNMALTNNQTISFSWSDGTFNGGVPIIDYLIQWD
jgi:hypothetical protein